jgi:hypothetical protein
MKQLEITPPAFFDKSIEATESLFSALYRLGEQNNLERILNRRHVFSVEIHSNKQQGIRFIIVAPDDRIPVIEKLVESYIPDAKTKQIETSDVAPSRVFEFRQKKHFAYPIHDFEEMESNDPLAYLTSAMTKLDDNEVAIYQIVVRPTKLRQAEKIRKKILRNDAFTPEARINNSLANPVLSATNKILFGMADVVSAGVHNDTTRYNVAGAQKELDYKKQLARGDKPVRTLSYFEHEVIETVNQKLKRPLFDTNIRFLIQTNDKNVEKKLKKMITSSLGIYDVPGYQSLVLKRRRFGYSKRILQFVAKKRINNFSSGHDYFSANELSRLYHFPHSESAKTANVVKSLSKILPAPVSLKSGHSFDVLVGLNNHHGISTPIGLTTAERERHMYVIGGTGNGKTTLLKYQIVQDIKSGKGIALVDPHGDLAEEILGYIPEERMKDIIYINPDDLEKPVGINLLELPEGLSGDDLLREKDLVTESAVSVLRKIFSEDDSGGHRIEYVLRNTIQTALTMDSANLFTIFRLLNDTKFRKSVVNKLEDKDLKIFWLNEIGKAGEMQRVKMAAGITAKIGRFLFSASARKILEQDKSTIDFDKAMDEKKIIICNFSKGLLGEDTSMLFGVTLLAKIQLAALRRARTTQTNRLPFFLYVDEFQNFATMSFVQMLSEARKYKLFLVMAEQSTQQQQEQRLVDIVLANVGTVIAFRSGSPADERMILPLFRRYVNEGEIANLPAYNFYCRIAAVDTQEPMSGTTVLVDADASEVVAKKAKQISRDTYGYIKDAKTTEPSEDKTDTRTKTKKRKKKSTSLSGIKKKASV